MKKALEKLKEKLGKKQEVESYLKRWERQNNNYNILLKRKS